MALRPQLELQRLAAAYNYNENATPVATRDALRARRADAGPRRGRPIRLETRQWLPGLGPVRGRTDDVVQAPMLEHTQPPCDFVVFKYLQVP